MYKNNNKKTFSHYTNICKCRIIIREATKDKWQIHLKKMNVKIAEILQYIKGFCALPTDTSFNKFLSYNSTITRELHRV